MQDRALGLEQYCCKLQNDRVTGSGKKQGGLSLECAEGDPADKFTSEI